MTYITEELDSVEGTVCKPHRGGIMIRVWLEICAYIVLFSRDPKMVAMDINRIIKDISNIEGDNV